MSRSYHKKDSINLECNGPGNDKEHLKVPVKMSLERGYNLGELVIFPVCDNFINVNGEQNGNCSVTGDVELKCKYYGAGEKSLEKLFRDSN